jgi:RNA polymerase sigma factor (sigma-70 family)
MNDTAEVIPGAPSEAEVRIEDRELLRRYVEDRDQRAFGVCVHRHVDLVYSAALRRLGGDAHSASDVTQRVFTALARQAATLAQGVVLPAWLYATTRHLTANLVRAEQRRRTREQEAHAMNELNATLPSAAEWERLRPMLDEVMDELGEPERGAVLLRFFARRPFTEIGAALQVSEDAARMRVERALAKLRVAFGRRGVASTASALATVLSHHAVAAAPAGLAATATGAALSGVGVVAGALAFMALTKFQAALVAAVIIAGATGFTWQQRRVTELREASATLQAQLARQAGENARLEMTQAQAETQMAALRAEIATLKIKSPASSTAEQGRGGSVVAATLANEPAGPNKTAIESRVARIAALVGLTPEQQARVAEIFRKETAALEAFAAGDERATKGMEARQAARAEVRAMLTPEQRQKYDVSPQRLGGGLPADPANLVASLDQKVTLTAEQKQKATAIIWDDLMDQMAKLPAEQALPGFRWSDKVRDQLRGVLTSEQQATFDQTTPYRKSGTNGGTR